MSTVDYLTKSSRVLSYFQFNLLMNNLAIVYILGRFPISSLFSIPPK